MFLRFSPCDPSTPHRLAGVDPRLQIDAWRQIHIETVSYSFDRFFCQALVPKVPFEVRFINRRN